MSAFRPFSWLSYLAKGGNVNILGLSSGEPMLGVSVCQATKFGMDFAICGTLSNIYCKKTAWPSFSL